MQTCKLSKLNVIAIYPWPVYDTIELVIFAIHYTVHNTPRAGARTAGGGRAQGCAGGPTLRRHAARLAPLYCITTPVLNHDTYLGLL